MEKLFNNFKGVVLTYPSYTGIVCGFTETHFILAVETKDNSFFKVLKKDFFVSEEYRDPKYRYILEDERNIEKTIKQNGN